MRPTKTIARLGTAETAALRNLKPFYVGSGSKAARGGRLGTSASPPKADIREQATERPLCARSGHSAYLFDHLVGAGEQSRWDF